MEAFLVMRVQMIVAIAHPGGHIESVCFHVYGSFATAKEMPKVRGRMAIMERDVENAAQAITH